MSTLPWDVPGDSVRLLVSRTLVRRVPSESFYYLPELRSLTLSCNRLSSISHGAFFNLKLLRELRLPGNVLTSFPWESLQETPSLRLLDLNGNRISSLPAESARFVSDLSTFDLSGNRLVTLPSDLLELWTLSAPTQAQGEGLEGDVDPDRGPVTPISRTPVRLILALQENPWLCDCSLSRLLLLARSAMGGTGGQGQGQGQACPAPPRVILMDPDTACGGPGDLAGVPMRLAGIATPSPPGGCRPPRVQVSASRLTSALGSSLLLRCDASGTPTPTLEWARGDGRALNATVIQESPDSGSRWSVLSLPVVSYGDAGVYLCRARNMAGTEDAMISLRVVGVLTTTASPPPPPPPRSYGGGSRPPLLRLLRGPEGMDAGGVPRGDPFSVLLDWATDGDERGVGGGADEVNVGDFLTAGSRQAAPSARSWSNRLGWAVSLSWGDSAPRDVAWLPGPSSSGGDPEEVSRLLLRGLAPGEAYEACIRPWSPPGGENEGAERVRGGDSSCVAFLAGEEKGIIGGSKGINSTGIGSKEISSTGIGSKGNGTKGIRPGVGDGAKEGEKEGGRTGMERDERGERSPEETAGNRGEADGSRGQEEVPGGGSGRGGSTVGSGGGISTPPNNNSDNNEEELNDGKPATTEGRSQGGGGGGDDQRRPPKGDPGRQQPEGPSGGDDNLPEEGPRGGGGDESAWATLAACATLLVAAALLAAAAVACARLNRRSSSFLFFSSSSSSSSLSSSSSRQGGGGGVGGGAGGAGGGGRPSSFRLCWERGGPSASCGREEELTKESYVRFESLRPARREHRDVRGGRRGGRRDGREGSGGAGERSRLLSTCTSVTSGLSARSDGSNLEYLC
ncbi:unnamed protein product [Lampetra planeri]